MLRRRGKQKETGGKSGKFQFDCDGIVMVAFCLRVFV